MNGETARRSLLLGAATGIRSTAALGILASSPSSPSGSVLRRWPVRVAAAAAFAGETLADKTAELPPRTAPLPLLGRVLLGAAAAALAASWTGASRPTAGFVGAATAAGAAWISTSLRSAARDRCVPDLAPALVEDGLVLGAAAAFRGRRRRSDLARASDR